MYDFSYVYEALSVLPAVGNFSYFLRLCDGLFSNKLNVIVDILLCKHKGEPHNPSILLTSEHFDSKNKQTNSSIKIQN